MKSSPSFKSKDDVQTADTTVLIYHDVCLKKSDGKLSHCSLQQNIHKRQQTFQPLVEILRGPFWLNDQIIAFYFQYLENLKFQRHSDKFCFVSPQISQLIKMHSAEDSNLFLDPLKPENKQVIFFAVNDNESARAGGTHWSLLVFSRQEESFFSFDSLGSLNKHATKKLVSKLMTGLHVPNAEWFEHETATQRNGQDCGLHLLANVENICDYYLAEGVVSKVFLLEASNVINKRLEILSLIKSLGGKF